MDEWLLLMPLYYWWLFELWFYDDSVDYMIYNWCLWNNVSTMPANDLLEWMSHINYIDIDDVWVVYIQLTL